MFEISELYKPSTDRYCYRIQYTQDGKKYEKNVYWGKRKSKETAFKEIQQIQEDLIKRYKKKVLNSEPTKETKGEKIFINCPCGGRYENNTGKRNYHFKYKRHQQYEEIKKKDDEELERLSKEFDKLLGL